MAALLALPALAVDFTYTYEGQTITYTVTNEAYRTVMTKEGDNYGVAVNNVTGDLVLPANPMNGDVQYTLTKIGQYSFSKNTELTSITFPNTLQTIDVCAFQYCDKLTDFLYRLRSKLSKHQRSRGARA